MKRDILLPNVVILGTGGTIAGKGSSSTNTAVYLSGAMDVNDLVKGTPEVMTVANCVAKSVLQKPSENMKVKDWITLATKAQEYLDQDDVDGIVVTHGTDTLEESSFFCHLVLHSEKPVVFTGAMRPATALSADGSLNLLNAVIAAGSKETRGLGSLVVMNEELYSARDVTKINTFKVNSFGSADVGPLGFIQEGYIYLYHLPYRKHSLQCEFDLKVFEKTIPKVDILYVYPSLDLDILTYYLKHNDGLIIAASGNGSISDDILPILEKHKDKCVIVRASRCASGIVTPNPASDRHLRLVSSGNLSLQKARVLLMMALTITHDPERIQNIFNMYWACLLQQLSKCSLDLFWPRSRRDSFCHKRLFLLLLRDSEISHFSCSEQLFLRDSSSVALFPNLCVICLQRVVNCPMMAKPWMTSLMFSSFSDFMRRNGLRA